MQVDFNAKYQYTFVYAGKAWLRVVDEELFFPRVDKSVLIFRVKVDLHPYTSLVSDLYDRHKQKCAFATLFHAYYWFFMHFMQFILYIVSNIY